MMLTLKKVGGCLRAQQATALIRVSHRLSVYLCSVRRGPIDDLLLMFHLANPVAHIFFQNEVSQSSLSRWPFSISLPVQMEVISKAIFQIVSSVWCHIDTVTRHVLWAIHLSGHHFQILYGKHMGPDITPSLLFACLPCAGPWQAGVYPSVGKDAVYTCR